MFGNRWATYKLRRCGRTGGSTLEGTQSSEDRQRRSADKIKHVHEKQTRGGGEIHLVCASIELIVYKMLYQSAVCLHSTAAIRQQCVHVKRLKKYSKNVYIYFFLNKVIKKIFFLFHHCISSCFFQN